MPVSNCYKKLVWGAIFDFHDLKKATLLEHLWSKKSLKGPPIFHFYELWRDTVFHKTIIIIVPLGHRGFLKDTCSTEIGSFPVFVAFSCVMFSTTLLSLVFIKHR